MNFPAYRRRRGSALLIVLAMLLLLTGLVLAFFFRTGKNLTASKDYADESNVSIVAESALNLAITQIRNGTSNLNEAWVSQPGLIRTFDNNGNPVNAYKLYSSSQMTVPESSSSPFDPTTDTKALTSSAWATQPNLYTDLNSPVFVSVSGTSVPVFPILDGNNMANILVGNKNLLTYDAITPGVADIEGFGIDPSDPNYQVSYAPGSAITATNTPVPMPVQWLYLLQDGTLLSATAASGKDVDVGSGSAVPTTANPIVARIAFWTDDESSKINLNTAGEGTPWDTPVCITQPPPPSGPGGFSPTNPFDPTNIYEYDLAARPPVAGEYQSVPGHPATTCLSPVFGASIRTLLSLPGNPTGSARATYVKALDAISPRYSDTTSSQGGTVVTAATGAAPVAVTPNTNPLYATPDEVFYGSSRVLNGSTGTRAPQNLAAPANIPPLVAESRFFLTTSSSAPEVNVFNQPRVAIWPEPATASKRTAFDSAVALCSTVGANTGSGEPFYFTRSDPTSQTADWSSRNSQIYNYLTGLAAQAWPGYGPGTFVSKYGSDCNQIFTEIYDYIRCTNLLDPTPGATPYTNKASTSGATTGVSPSPAQGQVVPILPGNGTRGLGRIATISELALVLVKLDNRWDVSQDDNAALTTNPQSGALLGPLGPRPNYEGNPALPVDYANQTEVEFSLLPHLFSPSAGYPALANDLKIVFSKLNLTVKDSGGVAQSLFTSSDFTGGVPPYLYDTGRVPHQSATAFGGYIGPWALTQNATAGISPITDYAAAPAASNVPTCIRNVAGLSEHVTYKGANPGSLTVAGTVHVDVYAPNGGSIIQSFDFTFPSTVVPVPDLALTISGTTKYVSSGLFGTYAPKVITSPTYGNDAGYIPAGSSSTGRGGASTTTNRWGQGNCPIQDSTLTGVLPGTAATYGDVVTSVQASGSAVQGDLRLIAASASPTSTYGNLVFTTQTKNNPSSATNAFSYGFYCYMPRTQNAYPGTTHGNLISMTQDYYNLQQYPGLPGDIGGSTLSKVNSANVYVTKGGVSNYLGNPGDWDNGPGLMCDGPYINKPDEGAGLDSDLFTSTASGIDASVPYIGSRYSLESTTTFPPTNLFNPSRQIPSPVMFGSLPTGVLAGHPWQTLLFHPAKSYFAGGTSHPGAAKPNPVDGTAPYPPYTTPPDHLLLDLFWMPTVQPTAISQPFATSGKVNLNYQIAPFTYIKRSTAMRAVLKSVEVTAINPTQTAPMPTFGAGNVVPPTGTLLAPLSMSYKSGGIWGSGVYNDGYGGGAGVSVRRPIDLDHTLQQFDDLYFSLNHPFITESDICDVPLIPSDNTSNTNYVNAKIPTGLNSPSATAFDSTYLKPFWTANTLTGDNSLERPYAAIYPRITTKSNVYTVHVRVQTLKMVPSSSPSVFQDGVDRVTGEFRGSFVVERYLDPNSSGFYNNGTQVTSSTPEQSTSNVLGPYQFRVLNTKQFAP